MDHVDVAAVYEDVYAELKLPEEFTFDNHEMLNAKVANLKEMLNESVYIPISFNGETTIKLYEHSKKESLFVLFDEIGKVQTLEKMYACLRGLTAIITGIAFSRCHVIISSLEVSNMMISASKSGRLIHFVPLNPLSVESALKLFSDYTRFEYVKRLIVTLGGHPRGLEVLFEILKCNSHFLGSSNFNYQKLFTILSVAKHAISYFDLSIEDVRPALLRLKVPMSKVVHNRTYEESVERGLYLNYFTDEEMEKKGFVPVISPFALSIFASRMMHSQDEGSLLYQIGYTLYQLTDYLTINETDLRGTPFEIAHGLWETLIRLLYQSQHPGQSVILNLTSIYPSFASKTALQDFMFVVPSDTFLFERTEKQSTDMDRSQVKPNVIYHFGRSNAGFDLACYPKAGSIINDLCDVAWNIETRLSTDDASTVEPINAVKRKMDLTLKQYEGLRKDLVFLVVVLKRKIAKNFEDDQLPDNCIVLTTEHLADCYGKSLGDYLLFLKND
ncbi:hypothetical protein O9G_005944 [Rozella allomycis CSF55]|uniref:Uncharacterized protein n=1 Tax=Rozella allomycis (strain CSF55) TaxID=988480 RepID=A0A075B397_ROZAC|nr:hypothetical protein O9G_005944 [Rozella allomycis CSF55]|eukprot:EPZ35441.1 hypothetical protein O9G_005944 [Rozella allomycis CSF55]